MYRTRWRVRGPTITKQAAISSARAEFMGAVVDEANLLDEQGSGIGATEVVLPLSRPALVTTAIFSFIWTWNDFFRQLVYLSQLKDYTAPVALTLFIDSTSESSVGPMFAMSLLSLVPVFLFFVAFQRLLVEGINTSGIKG